MDSAKELVAYMMSPETQVATLRATNFFPVIDVELPDTAPHRTGRECRNCQDDWRACREPRPAASGTGRERRRLQPCLRGYQALHDIDLTIADQEFMVLLGASGCGKSTLLRIIAGLETATSGEVWIGGRRVDHLSPKDRGISMVFQNYAVFPHLTVFENIGFGLRMKKCPKRKSSAVSSGQPL